MRFKRARKQIFCILLSVYLVASNLIIARAEALPDVMEGATTIADCVMSYYYMSGTSIANTTWINNLYSQFGATLGTVQSFAEQGLMVINSSGIWEPAQELYDTIANVPGYTALGLDQVFQVTAEEATAIGASAAVSGATTLGGAIAHVATTGVLPAALAVAGGVALGVGINYVREHLLNYFGKVISNGKKIDTNTILQNAMFPAGSSMSYVNSSGFNRNWYGSSNTVSCIVKTSSTIYFYFINYGSSKGSYRYRELYNNSLGEQSNRIDVIWPNADYKATDYSSPTNNYSADYTFTSISEYNNFKTRFLNGEIEKPVIKSPDVIGPNGNVKANYDPSTQKYSSPNSTTQVDPNTQVGKPLTQEDWLQYANTVTSNNSNPDIDGDAENANAFQELLNSIIVPKPSVDPDNPTDPDNPENPDNPSNPQESENPDNPSNPQESEDPDNPSNPQESEDPDNPSNPQESENPDNPSNPQESEDPDNPSNPQESEDPDNPSNPQESEDPDNPSNPQESEDPDNPVNPDNPNDPDNPVDPDNPADPDHPTNPDPETYPDPNPVQNPQPVPDPEVWPDYPEQPQFTEKQSENETDVHEGDPWTTPDLINKFPFCIPNDIKNIFSKLNSGTRQAPHIAWRFNPPGTPVDYTFDVDFSTWDSVAILLRNLELMAFVVALGVATKNLILA